MSLALIFIGGISAHSRYQAVNFVENKRVDATEQLTHPFWAVEGLQEIKEFVGRTNHHWRGKFVRDCLICIKVLHQRFGPWFLEGCKVRRDLTKFKSAFN